MVKLSCVWLSHPHILVKSWQSYPLQFPKFQIVTAKYVGSESEMIWNYPRRLLLGTMGSLEYSNSFICSQVYYHRAGSNESHLSFVGNCRPPQFSCSQVYY